MPSLSTESKYVAEIGVPVAVHAGAGWRDRQSLDPAREWGILRGYWDIWYRTDSLRTDRPVGLLVTAEYLAADREAAEDHALALGYRVGMLSSFFAGSPVQQSRLIKIAQTDPAGRLTAQWDYFYDSEFPPSIRLDPPELHAFLSRFADASPQVRERLERAARWYALSIGGLSEADKFLAVWVGLESIEDILSRQFHPRGKKAPCPECGNQAGKTRGHPGIEHLVRTIAPELLETRTFQELKDLRNDIAHGLRPLNELIDDLVEVVPDAQLCLAVGVLVAHSGATDEPTYGWHGALPRDYSHRPDARAELIVPIPLPNHQPYLGSWVKQTREFDDSLIEVNSGGEYARDGVVRTKFEATVPKGMSADEIPRRYEIFGRLGVRYSLTNKNTSPEQPVEIGAWRQVAVSAAWQRVVAKQEGHTRSAK